MLNLRKGYFSSVSHVDDEVGRVLDWLDRSKMPRDTITVLLGDHGMMLGDKAMWKKRVLFAPATQIPLMIRLPGVKGKKVRCMSYRES